jgi:hypothetical protein
LVCAARPTRPRIDCGQSGVRLSAAGRGASEISGLVGSLGHRGPRRSWRPNPSDPRRQTEGKDYEARRDQTGCGPSRVAVSLESRPPAAGTAGAAPHAAAPGARAAAADGPEATPAPYPTEAKTDQAGRRESHPEAAHVNVERDPPRALKRGDYTARVTGRQRGHPLIGTKYGAGNRDGPHGSSLGGSPARTPSSTSGGQRPRVSGLVNPQTPGAGSGVFPPPGASSRDKGHPRAGGARQQGVSPSETAVVIDKTGQDKAANKPLDRLFLAGDAK